MEVLEFAFYAVGILCLPWISLMATIIAGLKVYAYFSARSAVSNMNIVPLEALMAGQGVHPLAGGGKSGSGVRGSGGAGAAGGKGTHGQYL